MGRDTSLLQLVYACFLLGNYTCIRKEYPNLDWSCIQFGSCLLDTSIWKYHTGYKHDEYSDLFLFSIPLKKDQECFALFTEIIGEKSIETYSGYLSYNQTHEYCAENRQPDIILQVLS